MKFLLIGYTIYCFMVFLILFLLFFPVYWVIIQKEKWHKFSYYLNKWWAISFFRLSFFRVEVEGREKINPNQTYVFVPNHFSYLDIAIMSLLPVYFVFVGKISLTKIPLFGYMFKKLHIAVDRESRKSSYNTVDLGKKAIDRGKSLVMFAEGGIRSKNPPKMASFKDGPFRIAIEKQIAVVPISIPFNWIVLPDYKLYLDKKHKLKLIIHEPISTEGLEISDIPGLKSKTFKIIDKDLKYFNNYQPQLTYES